MTEGTEAVLFDAGGILWDLCPSVESMFAEELARLGSRISHERLRSAVSNADRRMDAEFAKLDGRDEKSFWRRFDAMVLNELGTDVDPVVFAERLSMRIRDVVTKVESWVAYPDAVPALKAVRAQGLRTGMVSNATELARRVLRNLDMERYLDVVVISEEVGVRKPDPRIFRIALAAVGASPSSSVFVGDRPATDMAGAERAGLKCVLVDRRGTFPASGYVTVRGLDELPQVL